MTATKTNAFHRILGSQVRVLTEDDAVTITPEMARRLLEANTFDNREFKAKKLNGHKQRLIDGRWKLTQDGLASGPDGDLINGQHRLTAIAETGVAAPLFLIDLRDEDVFSAIDTGAPRNRADVLRMNGYSDGDSKNLAAMVPWVHTLLASQAKGTHPTSRALFFDREKGSLRDDPVDPQECLEELDKYPEMIGSCKVMQAAKNAKIVAPGMAGALHYLMRREDESLADWFWEAMNTGDAGSCRTLITTRESVRKVLSKNTGTSNARRYQATQSALIIIGWNYIREGKNDIRRVSWITGSPFPCIK